MGKHNEGEHKEFRPERTTQYRLHGIQWHSVATSSQANITPFNARQRYLDTRPTISFAIQYYQPEE